MKNVDMQRRLRRHEPWADGRRGSSRAQDQYAPSMGQRFGRRRHRQARRNVHRRGGKWEQTSIAGHTANTLAKCAPTSSPAMRRPPCSSRARKSPNGTRRARPRSRRPGQGRGLGESRRARTAARDEATGKWVAAPMNIHRINWIWARTRAWPSRHHRIAEDLGRVQRGLRQGGRGQGHLPCPFQPGLDRRHDLRSGRLRPEYRPLPQGFRRRRHDAPAQPGDDQGVRAISPDDLQIYDPAIAGRDYDTTTAMLARAMRPFSSWATGRSAF